MNEECVLVGERDAVAEAQEAIRNAKICFRPLGDRIIVEPIDVDKTFIPGGTIVRSETANDRPTRGLVVAVGKGKKTGLLKKTTLEKLGEYAQSVTECTGEAERLPMDVKVGDQVLFTPYSGNQIEIAGVDITILHEEDVIAVIETN